MSKDGTYLFPFYGFGLLFFPHFYALISLLFTRSDPHVHTGGGRDFLGVSGHHDSRVLVTLLSVKCLHPHYGLWYRHSSYLAHGRFIKIYNRGPSSTNYVVFTIHYSEEIDYYCYLTQLLIRSPGFPNSSG